MGIIEENNTNPNIYTTVHIYVCVRIYMRTCIHAYIYT